MYQAGVGSATVDANAAARRVHKEVSGSTQSLLAHMTEYDEGDDEYIPCPDLMDFNSWQRWRTQLGRRPIKARDGYHTNPRQESILWRSTMEAVHGLSWEADLHRVTRQRSKTGNAAREPEHYSLATPVDSVTPGEVPTPRGTATPSSEPPSSASWSSQNPGTAGSLRALIFEGLNTKHSFAQYEILLRKQVAALRFLGDNVTEVEIQGLLYTALLISQGITSEEDEVESLKQEYVSLCFLLDGVDSDAKREAVRSMLLDRGIDADACFDEAVDPTSTTTTTTTPAPAPKAKDTTYIIGASPITVKAGAPVPKPKGAPKAER